MAGKKGCSGGYRPGAGRPAGATAIKKTGQAKAKKKKFTSARQPYYLENIMPAPDVINQELLNHFGGRELTEMHEM